MERIIKYFGDTVAELKQVSWPTQHQAMLYTVLVVAISVTVALFVGLSDFVFSKGINFLVNRF
jgi:preprotein translocase SecE subunit